VGAGVVGVKVLVNIEDEVCEATVQVLDSAERSSGAVVDEVSSGSVTSTRKKDLLAGSTRSADSSHGSLSGRGPAGDVQVMRLVHEAKDDLAVGLVLGRELAPKVGELSVRGSTLTDDRAIPASVVVDVDDARSTTGQATLNELVVLAEVGCVKCATEVVVEEVLPANWEAEDVETIILDEVVDLVDSIGTGVDDARDSAGTVSAAALSGIECTYPY